MATIIPYTNEFSELKSTTKITKQPDYDNIDIEQNQTEQNSRIWKELTYEIIGYAEHQLDKHKSQILDNTIDLNALGKDIDAYVKFLLGKYESYLGFEFISYFKNISKQYKDYMIILFRYGKDATQTYLYVINPDTNQIALNTDFLIEIVRHSVYI